MVVGHFQVDDLRRGVVAQLRSELAEHGKEVCRRRVEIFGGICPIGRPGLLQFGFRLANCAGGIRLVVPIGLYQTGHGNPLLHFAVLNRQDFEFLPATDVLVRPIPLCQVQTLPLPLFQSLRPVAKECSRPGEEKALLAGLRKLDRRPAEIEEGDVLLVGRQPQRGAQRDRVDQQ